MRTYPGLTPRLPAGNHELSDLIPVSEHLAASVAAPAAQATYAWDARSSRPICAVEEACPSGRVVWHLNRKSRGFVRVAAVTVEDRRLADSHR